MKPQNVCRTFEDPFYNADLFHIKASLKAGIASINDPIYQCFYAGHCGLV